MKKRRIINENPTPIEELLRRNGALIDESVEEGFVEIICSDGSVMRVGADFNMFERCSNFYDLTVESKISIVNNEIKHCSFKGQNIYNKFASDFAKIFNNNTISSKVDFAYPSSSNKMSNFNNINSAAWLEKILKESFYHFNDPYIVLLEYVDNLNFDIEKSNGLNIGIKKNISKHADKPEAFVSVAITLGEKEEGSPFYINIEMASDFSWDIEIDNDTVDNFLQHNAISLLIGYIRPIISNLTSSSRYPTFNLPFIDLSDDD